MRIIIPNYHVILIHLPLAMLGIGLLAELFSFLWRGSSFRQAGRWMILLGALLLLPATTSGIFALADVAGHGNQAESWDELTAGNGFQQLDWNLARNHILFNSIGATLVLLVVVGWIGSNDRWRSRLYFPGLLLMLAAMGLITLGAWHGGEMIYREGFGVSGKLGVLPEHLNPPADLKTRVDEAISPMQIHLIFAGLVFAVAAAALGLSLRRSWVEDELHSHHESIERAADMSITPQVTPSDDPPPRDVVSLLGDSPNAAPVTSIPPRDPSARFWVISAILALLTVALGFYVGDYFQSDFKDRLQRAVTEISRNGGREGLHIVFGTAIVLLTFLLGIFARWTPRKRLPLGIFSALLILIMAAQVWIGILLLYDGGGGPWLHFKRPATTEMNHSDTDHRDITPREIPATTQPAAAPVVATQPSAI